MTGYATESAAFDYAAAPVPVRPDIVEAHERAWDRLRRPGTWWTGAERIEIAAEVRNALECDLCGERKSALSPFSVDGEHHHTARKIDSVAVDAVHRIVTDATRLTRDWVNQIATEGLTDGHYVELLGVVVAVLSIDELHRGLGIEPAKLPTAVDGEPTHVRPDGLTSKVAWVPVLTLSGAQQGPNADLFAGLPVAPNVIAAMSLVPDAVRQLKELSEAYYVPAAHVANPSYQGRALNRSQIELVAGRVSALNECFY